MQRQLLAGVARPPGTKSVNPVDRERGEARDFGGLEKGGGAVARAGFIGQGMEQKRPEPRGLAGGKETAAALNRALELRFGRGLWGKRKREPSIALVSN